MSADPDTHLNNQHPNVFIVMDASLAMLTLFLNVLIASLLKFSTQPQALVLFLNVRLITVCNVISIKSAEHANKDTDLLMMFVKNAQSKTAKAAEHPSVNVMLALVSKASFTTPIKRNV